MPPSTTLRVSLLRQQSPISLCKANHPASENPPYEELYGAARSQLAKCLTTFTSFYKRTDPKNTGDQALSWEAVPCWPVSNRVTWSFMEQHGAKHSSATPASAFLPHLFAQSTALWQHLHQAHLAKCEAPIAMGNLTICCFPLLQLTSTAINLYGEGWQPDQAWRIRLYKLTLAKVLHLNSN